VDGKFVKGFCDGSAQSECKRDDDNNCMLYGANDNHLDLHGNALSGWLVLQIPNVKEGNFGTNGMVVWDSELQYSNERLERGERWKDI
jgi:hypothetical protein